MSFYDRQRALAARLALKYLVDASLHRRGNGYDRLTGKGMAGGENIIPCRARLTPIATQKGDLVTTTETTALIDTLPEIGDTLVIEGRTFDITEVRERAPDGKSINWTVVLK